MPFVWRSARALAVIASLTVSALGIAVLAGARNGTLRLEWAPVIGATASAAVDPLSAAFLAASGLVLAVGAYASERVARRRAYFALWDLMLASIAGMLVARDLLLFFVFWDATIVPVALLVWRWGERDRRAAAERFVAHALAGSALLLVGIVSLAVARGTLDVDALAARRVPSGAQLLPAMLTLAGLAVRVPVFPLHGWLPRLVGSAPIPVSIAVVGALSATAVYAIVRIPLYLFPEGMSAGAPLLAALAAVGALYAAVVAMRATDLRRFVAFSAMAQADLAALALVADTTTSLRGAVLAATANALVATLALALTAAIAKRTSSFAIARAGGLASSAPALGGAFTLAALAIAAVPGTFGFGALTLALVGSYDRFPVSTALASLVWIVSAVAAFGTARRIFAGPPLVRGADLRVREVLVIAPLLVVIVALGVAPRLLSDGIPDSGLPSVERLR